MPKWRNWQTQQTQNLPLCEQRAGSTPAFGTIADDFPKSERDALRDFLTNAGFFAVRRFIACVRVDSSRGSAYIRQQ